MTPSLSRQQRNGCRGTTSCRSLVIWFVRIVVVVVCGSGFGSGSGGVEAFTLVPSSWMEAVPAQRGGRVVPLSAGSRRIALSSSRDQSRRSFLSSTALSIAATDREEQAPHDAQTAAAGTTTVPIFDFTEPSRHDVKNFDRIDDAIMGGISTSQLRQSVANTTTTATTSTTESSSSSYASWSGVCRTDGGGFCGTRTLPFQDGRPLSMRINPSEEDGTGIQDGNTTTTTTKDNTEEYYEGFFITVRFASDQEPERRVWKLSTRTENVQNTEQVYQAIFEIPKQQNDKDDTTGWTTIYVPFASFIEVRGPRIVENAPPLNVQNGGIYQIGLSLSKFQTKSTNVTELPNFRSGYFDLHIQTIGVYYHTKTTNHHDKTSDEQENQTKSSSSRAAGAASSTTPVTTTLATTPAPSTNSVVTLRTVTKQEAKQNRPWLVKLLLPLVKLFFNEQRQRNKAVTKLLREQRGWSTRQIWNFGFQRRVQQDQNLVKTLGRVVLQAVAALVRVCCVTCIRCLVLYPLRFLRRRMKTSTTKPS